MLRVRSFVALLSILAASDSVPTSAAESVLVDNGTPRAEIVIAADPPRSVRLAAVELQTYIEKISGARLPIVFEPSGTNARIYVGRSPHTDKLGVSLEGLKHGSYRFASGDDWLAIVGDDTNFVPKEPWARNSTEARGGKLQAEWEKITGEMWSAPNAGLYKHRFKMPADFGLPEGVNTSAAPGTPAKQPPTVEHWGLDERGSYNGVCGLLHKWGVRWYLPGDLGEVVPQTKSIALPRLDETVHPDFEVRRFNVRFSIVSPETRAWAMRLGVRDPYELLVAHGMVDVTGRDEIYAAHPEWFALYGGERRYVPGYSKNQLCYSNPELFDESVRYARALFDHYGYEGVSIMPPDGYTSICQCPLCAGKDEPARGGHGSVTNHVWDFVNRVAKETRKTHPDKLIVCCAYGVYTDVPTNIDRLEPNVQVVIVGGRRPRASKPEEQAEIRALREAWAAKSDRPLMVFENYPITDRGWYLPAYVARTIGRSINETKGKSLGEDIWLTFGADFDKKDLGFNHFQVYFTARMYWGGPQADVEAMLDEYCRLFYGPAAAEAKAFFTYCEDHWAAMETDAARADEALALFDAAKSRVETSSVYGRRLALIDEFLNGLRRKRAQLAQKRGVVPKLRMVGEPRETIVIDGRLDDHYWQNCPVAATGRLRELETGREPAFGTTVKAGWHHNSVYFAIRCDERPGEKPNITATKRDDSAIWYGDVVELLLASDSHSYYQIAVNPAGTLVDYDRGADKAAWSGWASQAEVATHVADDHWTIEIRIPVTDDENDPLNQIVGNKPTQSLPWYLNICRQRARADGMELSALSPTGSKGFHDPLKFAHFYDGRSHAFESDPSVTDFASRFSAAHTLLRQGKRAEALSASLALVSPTEAEATAPQAAGKNAYGKLSDLQISAALEQAAEAARILRDPTQAAELAERIPLEPVKEVVRMQNLLAERKAPEVVARYGATDFAKWPFWKRADAYRARGQAYATTGDTEKAKQDFRQALEFTTDPRKRAAIEELLAK
jgi:tetratricopeptide (TPR) repeat protein